MSGVFTGWTAENYLKYRRDVPEPAIDQIAEHFALGSDDGVLDLGAGTGQLLVPLARRVRLGIGLEPEPDMLRRLRERADNANVVCVLGGADDLPRVTQLVGAHRLALVTVANALHWMDAPQVFSCAQQLLRPGGGIAIVNHGLPMWLGASEWAQAVNRYLQEWLGERTGAMCGLDDDTRAERIRLLHAAGFTDVVVLRHDYRERLSPDWIIGHLYSALSEQQVPPRRRAEFEAGLRDVLSGYQRAELIEDVPVTTTCARSTVSA